ncbi:MAG: lysylphosphatidylglycerol synthase transmembrane domain-containing protein [Bacteroidota bacterium]
MKGKIISGIRIILFLAVGLFLFWLVYRDQKIDEIISALREANYFWIAVSLVLSLFSHLSRAIRWNLLINPLGYKPRLLNSFFAVMVMYISNMAIPRSGEIARCTIVKKYEKVPLTQLLGTVVIERVFDFIMLFILLFVVLITQMGVVLEFVHNNPGVEDKFDSLLQIKYLIILAVMFIALVGFTYFFRKKFKESIVYKKMRELLMSFISGLDTVRKMDRKWEFIGHSIFIWAMYFLMIYVTFWSFEFTEHLTAMAGLTVFVMASFGMVAPSPGGIGTWHFMAIETLIIYGIEKTPDANAFAFAAHGAMTLFLLVVGVISLVMLPIINNKVKGD